MPAIEPRDGELPGHETMPAETGPQHGALGVMAVGALGVVYGDIGTSPLYTFKTAIEWAGDQATPGVALGILSLVVWTLIITTSLKYVAIVMRADNDGEGGILALMSLLAIKRGERSFVIAIGIIGAAMLYGDGAITPAISVLSALEGLKGPLPSFTPYVLPLSVLVLIALFAFQPQGTGRIGALFGPVMIVWFLTIGLLGIAGIVRHPGVLAALDPRVGIAYLIGHGLPGARRGVSVRDGRRGALCRYGPFRPTPDPADLVRTCPADSGLELCWPDRCAGRQ